jgi:hypothetical protein
MCKTPKNQHLTKGRVPQLALANVCYILPHYLNTARGLW